MHETADGRGHLISENIAPFDVRGMKSFTPSILCGFYADTADAYKFGAPPHGGMAYGLDRMVMLMLKKDSIRDVIAFPKVQNAGEPMSGAPDIVDPQQLKDLSIALTLTE